MQVPNEYKITRTELATWYGITERALRYRMKEKNLCVENCILTWTDIRFIIEHLGVPPHLPPDVVL